MTSCDPLQTPAIHWFSLAALGAVVLILIIIPGPALADADTTTSGTPGISYQKSTDAIQKTSTIQVGRFFVKKTPTPKITLKKTPTPRITVKSTITPRTTKNSNVQQLVKDLRKEYSISKVARDELVRIGPSTINAILPLLREQDYYVRFAAADTLRRLNYRPESPEAEAYYIVGLREYDTGLYEDNFNRLVALGSPAVDPLILYLQDSNWMKGSDSDTIEVLVAIGQPAVPKLIKALDDPVSRESAGCALLLIGDARGRQAVTRIMNQEGIRLSDYTENYKQIIRDYDPYDADALDYLWLGLALESSGTKEMATVFVNNLLTPLHLFGEKWAASNGYRVVLAGLV